MRACRDVHDRHHAFHEWHWFEGVYAPTRVPELLMCSVPETLSWVFGETSWDCGVVVLGCDRAHTSRLDP